MRPNFIQTVNPFALATPPAWFLKALAAYDPLFVIFPSVKEALYRTGRYGRYGHGLLSVLKNNPDTSIYVAHRIWPWKPFLPQTIGFGWNRILIDLPNYDTQRFGSDPGATLDANEAQADQAIDRQIASDLDAMNSDTYRTMKLRTGQRVGGGGRPRFTTLNGEQAQRMSRQSSYRPSGFGAGAMFVGR